MTTEKYTFAGKEVTKADSFREIRELVNSDKYDVFFNLCDGGRDEKRAGVEVVSALEERNAAFTGADWRSFEPNKIDMKVLVGNAGVRTPNFVLLTSTKALEKKCRHLKFPVIVKHVSGCASIGIHKDNRCDDVDQLRTKLDTFIKEYDHALVEEFIRGKEGTVLVCRDPESPHATKVFRPMFFDWLRTADEFVHFESKWCGDWKGFTISWMEDDHPAYQETVEMARNSFVHVLNGVGYGRADFRIDDKGHVYFLEINPNCGMWYPQIAGEGDFADQMVVKDEKWTHETFVETACRYALEQQKLREPWYVVSHDSQGHFTARASATVEAGRALFGDAVHQIPVVAKALYKVGAEDIGSNIGCVVRRADGIQTVVALRHSCEPNMTFIHGSTMTCAARRQINAGEELSIDYSTIRDVSMPTFACRCGTVGCRNIIVPHPPMPRSVDHKYLRKLLRERKAAALEARRARRQAALEKQTADATLAAGGAVPPPSATPQAAPDVTVKQAPVHAAAPANNKAAATLVATAPATVPSAKPVATASSALEPQEASKSRKGGKSDTAPESTTKAK
jgi:D-alanine-D-alanine ligase-like ATP-grasp enzyme